MTAYLRLRARLLIWNAPPILLRSISLKLSATAAWTADLGENKLFGVSVSETTRLSALSLPLRATLFSSSSFGIESKLSLLSLPSSVHKPTGGHGFRYRYPKKFCAYRIIIKPGTITIFPFCRSRTVSLGSISNTALSARPWEDPVKNGTVRGTFDPVGGDEDEFAV